MAMIETYYSQDDVPDRVISIVLDAWPPFHISMYPPPFKFEVRLAQAMVEEKDGDER